MSTRALVAAGLAVLLLGLLLGLIPGSINTGASEITCGSPWVRDTTMTDAANRGAELGSALAGRESSSNYGQVCSDALGGRGVLGGVLTGVGVLALLGVALVNSQQASRTRD
jgi:hypothetical protein